MAKEIKREVFEVTITGELYRHSEEKGYYTEQGNFTGQIIIDKTACTDYGNGRQMIAKGFDFVPFFNDLQDIRYDKDFYKMERLEYVKDYMTYWVASDKYFKSVQDIKVREITEH